MNFYYTSEQIMLKEMSRKFAETQIRPHIHKMETEKRMVRDLIKEMREVGFYSIQYPEKYGGSGSSYIEYVIMMEEIARVYSSIAGHISVNNLCAGAIYEFGTEEQRMKYLPELITGSAVGSFAFTEAATGSDPSAIRTTAVIDGDEWIINGEKLFITNSTIPGYVGVSCKDIEKEGHITTIIVPKNAKGYSAPKLVDKMGMHGMEVADIVLDEVRVPLENTLGGEEGRGKGYQILTDVISVGKLGISAQCVGMAQGALDASVKFAKERVQRGKPIASFQTIQWLIGEMSSEVCAARQVVLATAYAKSKGKNIIFDSARTRLFASQSAHRVASNAMQVHGAFGYTTEFPVERIFRDVKLTEIYEGVNEIQRVIAASELLR
jgi:butyryl-CoA dehydrogenase